MKRFKNISDYLLYHAKTHVEKNAFIFLEDGEDCEVRITYSELANKAELLAGYLMKENLHQQPVLLLFPSGIDFIVSFFASQLAGIIAVPLYPPRSSRHMERLRLVAADSGATTILTCNSYLSSVKKGMKDFLESGGKIINTGNLPVNEAANLLGDNNESDIAFIQYTSGSTGNPKGVIISNENLLANQEVMQNTFQSTGDEVIASWLPLYHDMGLVGSILHTVYMGTTCILMSPFHFLQKPIRWLKAIHKYKAVLSGGPNFSFDLCVQKISDEELRGVSLSSWRVAFNGSEPVIPDTIRRFTERFSEFGFNENAMCPCYGLAEATLMVSGHTPNQPCSILNTDETFLSKGILSVTTASDAKKIVTSGKIHPGISVKIMNARGKQCKPDEIGEICMAGKSISNGYWKKEKKEEEYFNIPDKQQQYLRTGDLGVIHEEQLYVTGRAKEMIIQKGKNYYPYDIERIASMSHPALHLNACAAFSIIQNHEEQLVLFMEVKRESIAKLPEMEIYQQIKQALIHNAEIDVYDVALMKPGSLPKTSSGKIKRKLCKEQYSSGEYECITSLLRNSLQDEIKREELPVHLIAQIKKHLYAGSKGKGEAFILEYLQYQLKKISGQQNLQVSAEDEIGLMGIDSMKMVELSSVIYDTLGVQVGLAALMSATKVKDLISFIKNELTKKPETLYTSDNERISSKTVSENQKALWMIDQIEDKANNIGFSFRVRGEFDEQRFKDAFHACIQENQSLQSYFLWEGDQVICHHASHPDSFPLFVDRVNSEKDALDKIKKYLNTPIPLDKAPLIRALLLREKEDIHYISITMHHIVSDGWSLQLIFNSLLDKLSRTPNAAKTTSGLTYSDFIAMENNALATLQSSNDVAFLKEKLEVEEKTMFSVSSGSATTGENKIAFFKLDKKTTIRLSDVCKVSPFLVLLGVFQLQLLFHSGAKQIITASPVSRRDKNEWRGITGFLASLLFIKSERNMEQSFPHYLRCLKNEFVAMLERQHIPYAYLLKKSEQLNNLNGYLQQFSFAYHALGNVPAFQQLYTAPGSVIKKINENTFIESIGNIPQNGLLNLELEIYEGNEELFCWLKYASDKFSTAFIHRFIENFNALLASVQNSPNVLLKDHVFVDRYQKEKVLKFGEGAKREFSQQNFIPLFRDSVRRHSHQTALRDAEKKVSYRELNSLSDRIAAGLNKYSIHKGHRVLLYSTCSINDIAAIIALWKIGASYILIDEKTSPEWLHSVFSSGSAKAILINGVVPRICNELSDTIIDINSLSEASDGMPVTLPEITNDAEAYIIYTSNASRNPNEILIRHTALVNLCLSLINTYNIQPEDKILRFTSLTGDGSVEELFPYLVLGAEVVLRNEDAISDFRKFNQYCSLYQISILQLPTAYWAALLALNEVLPASVRLVSVRGDKMKTTTIHRWFEKYPQRPSLFNAYRPAEHFLIASVKKMDETPLTDASIGKAIYNTHLYILTNEGQLAPAGVKGELCTARGIAKGYLNNPRQTDLNFVSAMLHTDKMICKTGDTAYWNEEGEAVVLGRKDRQIRIRGYWIELHEIENTLLQHPSVRDAIVLVNENNKEDQYIIAYVVISQRVKATDLKDYLARKIPLYMIPKQFIQLTQLPLTPDGKLDQNALLLLEETASREQVSEYVTPCNETQEKIVQIWSMVLDPLPPRTPLLVPKNKRTSSSGGKEQGWEELGITVINN